MQATTLGPSASSKQAHHLIFRILHTHQQVCEQPLKRAVSQLSLINTIPFHDITSKSPPTKARGYQNPLRFS